MKRGSVIRNTLQSFLAVAALALALAGCGGGGGGGGSASGGSGSAAPGSQGTLTAPVILSATTSSSGSVSIGGPSYYQFNGLVGGATYSVTFSNISGSILPLLYSSNGQANTQSCFFSSVSGTASCIVQASPAGNVFITVYDFSTGSSTYTISAALAVNAGQGLPTSPVAIPLGSVYNGSLTSGVSTTTYDSGNSGYYTLTGLTSYHQYLVTLTASLGAAQLLAYQSSYSAQACNSNCSITASGTSLLLQVRAKDTATFSISVTDLGAVAPFATQGAVGSEVALQLDAQTILNNGSVNTTKSYYTNTRLVPGQLYNAYLSSLADNVDLYVYSDAAYTKLACSSTNTGATAESCRGAPTAPGQLWIVANGSNAQEYLGSGYVVGLQRVSPIQGTSALPQIINSTTSLPSRVTYGNLATSYYKITGLAANTAMMVTLAPDHTMSMSSGNLSTYPPTGFGSPAACTTMNSVNYVYESCKGTTDASGNLFVTLDGGFFPANSLGGTGYLNVKPVPVNEGTPTAPLAKNMSTTVPVNTFTGQVAGSSTGYSYYALTNLTPNTAYYILASFGTDGQSASATVFNTFTTGSLTLETPVCSNSWSYLNNGCTATSDASGRLWVTIGGWYSDFGTNFKLEALPAPVSQGTAAAPLNITASLPYRATVAAGSSSYYAITGLTIGSEYFFTKYDTSIGESFLVYSDAALTSQVCSANSGPGREMSCRGTSTSGTAYIVLSNAGGAAAGYEYLNYSLVPVPEGSPATPIAYTTSGSLYAGKVNVGASYYHATLLPNTLYTISLSTVVGDPDLYVYNNAAMTGAAACSSIKGKNQAESCQATSDASGNLWVIVDGELSKAGGTYQLKIQ